MNGLLDNNLRGPYPILCRGHSGGRLLAEAFMINGISMGEVTADRKDTLFFSISNSPMRELVLNAYHYLEADCQEQQRLQDILKQRVDNFVKTEIRMLGLFGWKQGISLFTMPMILDAFPAAKVIHLIRDGRDVMLSRLGARFNNLADPLNRLTVFGNEAVDQFEGCPLNANTIKTFRNELEMQHWVTAVSYGLKCRRFQGRYLEIKYEDICRSPVTQFNKIFAFLDTKMLPQTENWLKENVRSDRIGKWKSLNDKQIKKPLEIGGELLARLGYI